jgi:hypothetical protein
MYDENDTAEERFIRRFIAGGGLVVIAAFTAILIMLDRGMIVG